MCTNEITTDKIFVDLYICSGGTGPPPPPQPPQKLIPNNITTARTIGNPHIVLQVGNA